MRHIQQHSKMWLVYFRMWLMLLNSYFSVYSTEKLVIRNPRIKNSSGCLGESWATLETPRPGIYFRANGCFALWLECNPNTNWHKVTAWLSPFVFSGSYANRSTTSLSSSSQEEKLLQFPEGNEEAICSYISPCRTSDRQIVIDAVWLEHLHLLCRSPVTSEDGLAKGLFDRRLSRFPSGPEWWTRLNRMLRFPFLRHSFLFLPAEVAPHLSDRPQWRKWLLKRTDIDRIQRACVL